MLTIINTLILKRKVFVTSGWKRMEGDEVVVGSSEYRGA